MNFALYIYRIIEVLPNRSNKLRTQAGSIIRRNGRLLRSPLPSQSPSSLTPSTSPARSTTNASTPSQSQSSSLMHCRLRDINQPATRARLRRHQPAWSQAPTRGCGVNLLVRRATNNVIGKSYYFRIAKLWNSLLAPAKRAQSLLVFKKLIA